MPRGSSTTSIRVMGSPRRLVIEVTRLSEQQDDAVHTAKGPSVKAAFAEDGTPTKAAEGFARGKGVAVESLTVVDDENGSYVYATVEEKGVSAIEVLPGLLARLVEGIEWPKSQRWGSGDARFARPVRWLLALFGGDVVAGRVRRACRRARHVRSPASGSRCHRGAALPMSTRSRWSADSSSPTTRCAPSCCARESPPWPNSWVARPSCRTRPLPRWSNLVEWPTVAVGTLRRGVPARSPRDPRERDGEPPAVLPGPACRRLAGQPLHRRPQR